ncbi:MAG: hypothetical protein AAFR56_08055 [Chloroflexota bacterium]
MFGILTSAFGLTVLLCLPGVLLVSLGIPPVLLHLTRPPDKDNPRKKGRRNPVASMLAFTRFYFISLVVITMTTIAFWSVLLLVNGTDNVINFASQSLPVDEQTIEEAVEPALTTEAER